jgi:hypothetical protein
MPCSLRQSSVSLNCLKASCGLNRRARRKRLGTVRAKLQLMEDCADIQKSLVVVARLSPAIGSGRCVIALLLAYLLERVERACLLFGQMPKMCSGVLERLDTGQVRHDDVD